MSLESPLAGLRVVLVRPQGPIHVGMIVRACSNFGLPAPWLVDSLAHRHPQALDFSRGSERLMPEIREVASLEEALAGTVYAMGTSVDRPKLQRSMPIVGARDGAARMKAKLAEGPVALVFGPERGGLGNEELARLHATVTIPTLGGDGTLNLSQAVTVLAYELAMAHDPPPPGPEPPAGHEELGRVEAAMHRFLRKTGLFRKPLGERTERVIRRLLVRADLSRSEAWFLARLLRHSEGLRRLRPSHHGGTEGTETS